MNPAGAARLYLNTDDYYERNAALAALKRRYWQAQARLPREKRKHLWTRDATSYAEEILEGG